MLRRTIGDDSQGQEVGDNSNAYQAGGDIVIHEGTDYIQIKDIVMDLFKANAFDLTRMAGDLARSRAEEVVEKYIHKLKDESPEKISNLNQPDMQYAIIAAQKAYARSGDKDLLEVLADILVNRTKEDNRNLLQVVLNEALEIAPKLTSHQFKILSAVFLFRYCKLGQNYKFSGVIDLIRQISAITLDEFPKSESNYTHIQYAGCGRVEISSIKLDEIIYDAYKEAFKGIVKIGDLQFLMDEQRKIRNVDDLISRGIIRRVRLDLSESSEEEYFEIVDNDAESLSRRLFMLGYSNEIHIAAQAKLEHTLEKNEATRLLLNSNEIVRKIIKSWNEGTVKNFQMSSVGIAIAVASIGRKTGRSMDLEIWIKDE